MKDVSVEYAHIYTHNEYGREQEVSMQILDKVRRALQSRDETFSLVILVDDYSFPDPTFDYISFSEWLAKRGFKPDLVFRESQLIPLCDQVLQKLPDEKLREQLVDYIKAKKYPCSLFIAAWYLLRLGHLEHDSFEKELIAKRVHNILPQSFKSFEDKALEILAASEYSGAEKLIEYSYLEGRLLE